MSQEQLQDQEILSDMLMTEKYVSGTYESSIMEASNDSVRQMLQHIQEEEQHHAKAIFDLMNKKGYYQVEAAQYKGPKVTYGQLDNREKTFP